MAPKKESVANASFEKYKNLLINPSDIAQKFGHWSTGSPRVDRLLGGGLTKGRMSEFFGRETTGKSTLALATARSVIALGGRVLYIDLERGLELRPLGHGSWLEVNGINPFDGTFDIIQQGGKEPVTAEQIYNVLIGVVRDQSYQYVVVDSMAAMVSEAELAGQIGDSTFGGIARINSQGLKTLFALQGSNHETSITWINQVRDQLQGGMGGLKSTGGRALPHYIHQKLRFDKLNRSKEEKSGEFLTPIRVRTEKARGAAASAVEITISSRSGIDVLSEVFDAGVQTGYIAKSGAWFTLFDTPERATSLYKCQGEADMKAYLTTSPLYDTLYHAATETASVNSLDGDE